MKDKELLLKVLQSLLEIPNAKIEIEISKMDKEPDDEKKDILGRLDPKNIKKVPALNDEEDNKELDLLRRLKK